MRVGGLTKVSTLDFPRCIAAVVYTQGCNFFCPYCQNPALVRSFGELMDEDGVLDFFRKRVKFLDGVVISGGEPTIVSDLIKFLESLRLLGYNIKLDTNGSKPSVIEELLKRNLVDYVALDLKSDPYNYPETLGPKEDTKEIPNTIELLKTYACAHEFRTTVVTPFITDETLLAIAKAAAGNAPLYLQYVRLSRVFDPTFMSKFPNQPKKLELMKLRKMASKYLPTFIR